MGAYRRTWLKENPGVVLPKLPAGNSVESNRPNPEASHCPGVKPLQRGAGFTGWHVCAVAETIHMRISFWRSISEPTMKNDLLLARGALCLETAPRLTL